MPLSPGYFNGGKMSLLLKNQPLTVDNENPFKDDCLERKTSIENLTILIQSLTQSFVISIEAPWGSGKTTYVKMWKQYLENNSHASLYFNAWENDIAADPLIAFLGEMNKLLEMEKNKGKNRTIKNSLAKVQKIGGTLIKKTLPITIQLVTQGIVSKEVVANLPNLLIETKDEIADAVSEITKDSIKAYEQEKNSIETFKTELAKFSELISTGGKRKPLVVFVDELDRCRPNYAIELLERIKHLFNVPGVVFVLSLDRQQLENSVAAIYGANIDTSGYLARFIDYRFRLPVGNDDNFVNYLVKRFGFDELFQVRATNNHRSVYEYDNFLHSVKTWFNILHLNLRLQEQCFTEMNIVLRLTLENNYSLAETLPFIATIKLTSPDRYQDLVNKTITPEELINSLPKSQETKKFVGDYIGGYFEGILYRYLCTEEQIDQKVQVYSDLEKSGGDMQVTKDRARGFLTYVHQPGFFYRNYSEIGSLISKFEIVDSINVV